MPSPFPGMNPYLEQDDLWHDFHLAFLPAMRERLVRQVAPRYIVLLHEHLYVRDLPDEPRRLLGRADVSLAEAPGAEGGAAAGAVAAPARVELLAEDVERSPFLEIRDRRSRDLIAVVELLSPSNKRPGPDREQYLAKRRGVLASPAHFVEIDLLRGGRPMPLVARPPCCYSVLVSRAEQRPHADFWPIGLRERLPEIAVPLHPPDGDARVDLQEILDQVYDGAGYEHFLYDGAPSPALAPDDAAWARTKLPTRKGS
ncbi:hypothetical protein OJF2_39020 [Aquisphaera giovannonii]|uniref:DUF4058 domain-containing protein n=1 Tax=Aquisphaera giovannonii TaxID=406548 RepID=A0A5B9W5V0_9BACT|nr:DUF4058 family protein [Aquisphaera giovannonii]QEH35351.1 hypothetical protein OJF2_39020 [Aquisphaera giovannonii]